MTEDRRHAPNPHPPPGCPEQRECSDENCKAARKEWLMGEVMPHIEKRMYMIVVGAIGVCAASFVWLHDLSNTKLELKIKETYEDRGHHDEDIKRMERMVAEINGNVSHAMNKILDNQIEIKEEIKNVKNK